jgi:acyl carrier protein
MAARIRDLIATRKLVPVAIADISDDADLYELGMTSFASVQLMLALEEAFDVEFPEHMLNRKTFATIAAIDRSIAELTAGRA